jgi:hypothetical protein
MSRLRLGLLLLALAAAPAVAAPRVTASLENATLHQTLVKLSDQTGVRFRSQEGAGADDYRDPPAGRRATLAWSNAPLGRALRDVCTAYGLTATPLGDAGYWLEPGTLRKRREASTGGIAVALSSAQQSEITQLTPGPSPPRVQRRLSLQLACRAEDGEGDRLGALLRLSGVDDRGRTFNVRVPPSTREPFNSMPDERLRAVSLPWPGEHARRFQRLEGELAVYDNVQEYRLAIPLQGGFSVQELAEQPLGPVRVHVETLTQAEERVRIRLHLEWTSAVEVLLDGPGVTRSFVRMDAGQPQILVGGFQPVDEEGDKRSTEGDFFAQFQGKPLELEIRVATRASAVHSVTFVLQNVALPYDRPDHPRLVPLHLQPRVPVAVSRRGARDVPAPLYEPGGARLRIAVPPPRGDEVVELAVGLSKQGAAGEWSGTRWVLAEVGPDGALLEDLAPGAYRVRLRAWRRGLEGAPQRLPIPDRAVPVQLRKGAETRLDSGQ